MTLKGEIKLEEEWMAKKETIVHALGKDLATTINNFKSLQSLQASMKTNIDVAKWDV